MSYYGIDDGRESLPRISDNRLTETSRRWQSSGVRFIDDYDVGRSSHYDDIWSDEMKHKYGHSKSVTPYSSKKRPTSADSSNTSSISSLKDSSEVSTTQTELLKIIG